MGIYASQFRAVAEAAKVGCPVSKAATGVDISGATLSRSGIPPVPSRPRNVTAVRVATRTNTTARPRPPCREGIGLSRKCAVRWHHIKPIDSPPPHRARPAQFGPMQCHESRHRPGDREREGQQESRLQPGLDRSSSENERRRRPCHTRRHCSVSSESGFGAHGSATIQPRTCSSAASRSDDTSRNLRSAVVVRGMGVRTGDGLSFCAAASSCSMKASASSRVNLPPAWR